MENKSFFLSILLTTTFFSSYSQVSQPVDRIIAVIGSNIVLQSDLEAQYFQSEAKQNENVVETRCGILEQLLFQKLLVNQGNLDSLKVSDAQVESEMDRRLRFFISQIGSEQKLEEYYGKSIAKIKDDFRELIKNQLLGQQMQGKITSGITITPSDVRAYYKTIPADSLPYINSEIEIGQIVSLPKISSEAKKEAREKIDGLRQRVMKGEKFGALAVLYSEDPGSARRSGELGFVARGSFVPEFEAVAYKLKEGETSEIIETQFGYHFMQLIERRGEQINVRHILISPKINNQDLLEAKNRLDSLFILISKNDTLKFADAAANYSDDTDTKFNGGLMLNPHTNTTKFETDQVDPNVFFTIDKLKVGELSKPVQMTTQAGKQGYRLLYLKSRSQPHKANLKDDYQRLQDAALEFKKAEAIEKWIEKKLTATYFHLDPEYHSCSFENFNLNSEVK